MGKSRYKNKAFAAKDYTSDLDHVTRIIWCFLEAALFTVVLSLTLPTLAVTGTAFVQPAAIILAGLVLAFMMFRFRFSVLLIAVLLLWAILSPSSIGFDLDSLSRTSKAQRRRQRR